MLQADCFYGLEINNVRRSNVRLSEFVEDSMQKNWQLVSTIILHFLTASLRR